MAGLRQVWMCIPGCLRAAACERCVCGRQATLMHEIDLRVGGKDWPKDTDLPIPRPIPAPDELVR